MDTPFFSLIASAIREDMYIDCYNSFAKTDIPFEMVFVGHKKPKRKMPENFRYIHTRVKPAQCLEIAARNARGKYLIPITDDIRGNSGFLGKLYKSISTGPNNIFYGVCFSSRGRPPVGARPFSWYKKRQKNAEVLPGCCSNFTISGTYERSMWLNLGGIDKRFIGAYSETDMQLRFFEAGKKLSVVSDCILFEHVRHDVHLYKVTKNDSKNLMSFLWIKNNQFIGKRLYPVEYFSDSNLLTKNQGPLGRWPKAKWLRK